jgi:hypothetical protein
VTRLIIDRVVIANASLAPHEADAFRAAVGDELQRLLAHEAMPVESRNALSVSLPETGRGPAALARNVAAAIHGALGKGR